MAIGLHGLVEEDKESAVFFAPSSPHVFVTGALGHLGRTLIRVLQQRGFAVRSIGRTSRECDLLRALGCISADIGDVWSTPTLVTAAWDCRLFVHCATVFAPRDGVQATSNEGCHDNSTPMDANACATHSVVAACRTLGVHKLVVVSGCAVMCGSNCDTCGVAVPVIEANESIPPPVHPHGALARALFAAEQVALQFGGLSGDNSHYNDDYNDDVGDMGEGDRGGGEEDMLSTCVVRPGLLWGGGHDALATALVRSARGGQLRLVGGGSFRISTCHVENASACIVNALRRGACGAVYFATDGVPILYADFVRRVLVSAGVERRAVDAALSRSVSLSVARCVARVAEWLARIFHWPPFLTEPAVCRLGQELSVCDHLARATLGYRNALSINQGMQLVRDSIH